MLRNAIVALLAGCMATWAVGAKSPEEKAAAIQQSAAAYVQQYADVREEKALAQAYPGVEKTWQAFYALVGPDYPMVSDLALIRARAASAAKDKKRVVEAWMTALKVRRPSTPPQTLVGLNTEAAYASVAAGNVEMAQQFFAAARAYAIVRGADAGKVQLLMRIRELHALGDTMTWRQLKDALTDLAKVAQTYPMWTEQRLESIVSEVELRMAYEPEGDKKRKKLSQLKAQIDLIVEGMGDSLPPQYVARVRSVNYALEDYYQL